ncbi:MAG: choice-of-anchor D domain-containing protein [Verrucomicrobiota bacterium]
MQRLSPKGALPKWAALAAVLLGSAAADAKIIYVNGAIAAPGNGTNWTKSYKYLRDGLDASAPGDVIYLAQGTYYPDDGSSGEFGNRELAFDLEGVKVYGGFNGTETNLNQRNPLVNVTTLSGGIWDSDVYWSLHVVEVLESSTLDGVKVEKGNAQGRASWNFPGIDAYDQGGGCYVNAGKTITLQNCIFTNNRALSFGGAIMVADTTGGVVATNCVFEFNQIPLYLITTSVPEGGAIYGKVTATNCKFISNSITASNFVGSTSASAKGGAISGNVTATGCEFTGNIITTSASLQPTASGGAIFGNVVATKCTFTANAANAVAPPATPTNSPTPVSSGGAIAGGSLQAVNCVFSANKSGRGQPNRTEFTVAGGGGAVYVSSGTSSVVNSVFVYNTSEISGGAIQSATTSFSDILTVLDCTFVDNGVLTSINIPQPPATPQPPDIIFPLNGSAIGCGGFVRIMNNLFWNTAAAANGFNQANLIHVYNKGVLRNTDVRYPTPSTLALNVVNGGLLGVTRSAGGDRNLGVATETLLIGNPNFATPTNPIGPDNVWRTADDGLRLTTGSSAIGVAGDPTIPSYRNFLPKDTRDVDGDGNVSELLPVDVASYARVQGNFLDMGAYEFGDLLFAPDISVEYPSGTILADGSSTAVDLSALAGVPTTFTIRNLGSQTLNKIAIIGDGVDIDSFKYTQPVTTVLGAGGITTFTVFFKPTATGMRNAALHIVSNDPDENPFDINLRGDSLLSEIAVETPVGTALTDGTSVVDYGSVGATSTVTKTFTIRNSGQGNLGILSIASSGTNAANFKVSAPGSNLLAPGATTTFNVTFSPSGTGSRSASIVIENSDPDGESSFLIKLAGKGVGSPEIVASEPFGPELATGTKSDFGSVKLNLTHTKTFVVKNTGTATLKNIAVSLSGSSKFTKTKIGVSSLAPGEEADFTVTFKPTATGKKTATLVIASNDANESQITLNLVGTGVSGSSATASSSLTAASATLARSQSGVGITVTRDSNGLKYLVLTVDKSEIPNLARRNVEVSSNLTKWFSGSKHTTVLLDNNSVLRVRDNTPVKQGEKRYIRLK